MASNILKINRKGRLAFILVVGMSMLVGLYGYRRGQLPEPAPEFYQASGKVILAESVQIIKQSAFGKTVRGRRLVAEVESFLAEDIIVFSSQLDGPRGLWWNDVFGNERIYLRILEMNHGKFLHQLPSQLMEAVFHEAVHACHGRFHSNSIEEECDAFIAGMFAEAVMLGKEPGSVLMIDGLVLGTFVLQSYSDLPRNPEYKPVAISLKEVLALAGLGAE